MRWLLLLFWIVPLIIAGGLMWFVACQLAPFGQEIKLSRGVLAVVLMGVFSVACNHWLTPLIGHWSLAAEFVCWTLCVMAVLKLSFWRSLLAVLIYSVVMVVAFIVIGMIAKSGGSKPNKGVAAIVRTAGPSEQRSLRQDQLSKLYKKNDAIFEDIESRYYKSSEALEVLMTRYVLANTECFL